MPNGEIAPSPLMNFLSVDGLAKHYGERVLFEQVSFGLAKGQKAALVANNGTGKTTLMRIVAGLDVADAGSYTLRQGVRLGYLPQEPDFSGVSTLTVRQYCAEGSAEIKQIADAYEQALKAAESGHEQQMNALSDAANAMDARGVWDFDRRLEAMLDRFRLTPHFDAPVGSLSGGQQKRLAIATVLADLPDLLLLDEPTNHLDLDMVEWLEQYFIQCNATLLMVTHDRYFLDRVCQVVFEMHRSKFYRHDGNYAYFLEKKTQREAALQTEVDKAGKLMKRELEWLRRQPKARTTKSKARIDAYDDIEALAHSRRKETELKLDVKMSRIGGKVLEMKKVYKAFPTVQVLKAFDYTFKKGERIGIVGKNGVGKTTFLNLITGAEPADSGKINQGETIVFGYYRQQGLQLKADKRVIEVLRDVADVIQLSDGSKVSASLLLQHFQFTPDMQHTFVSKLSGGERRRLHLLTVLMNNPNFLILDEPTNDLDLITLQKLEEFLENFGGALMVVSHDRYFLDKLVDHLFVFNGDGTITDFWGNYSEWKASNERPVIAREITAEAPVKNQVASRKLSHRERIELETLDTEVPALEAEKAELENNLMKDRPSAADLQLWLSRLAVVSAAIEEKSMRWLELDERRNER